MPSRVALLRGVNVGTAKRIAMQALRDTVSDLGYTSVQTVLQSGNIIFVTDESADVCARRIEDAIAERHDLRAQTGSRSLRTRVTVVPGAELVAELRDNPLPDHISEPSKLLIGVLNDPADARLTPLLARAWSPDELIQRGRFVWTWLDAGVLDSPLSQALAKTLKDGITSRNLTTMERIARLVPDA